MTEPSYRFGPFVLDRGSYQLTRDATVVDVTAKLLDLLFYFAGHAGALVTKDELLDAVWPDANVTENALTQAVSDLRDVLDDDPAEPRYIKTIARRGYRFIAEVEEVKDKVRLKPDATDVGDMVRLKPDTTGIAVMDFANLSGDTESAWLSNGIAETVTSDLRALGQFRIVDRRHVIEAARATDGSLHQVAGALGIRLAVVGGFQRQTDRIRITARLVDVTSGDALADAKVDGRVADIFELQDQVVRQLSNELGLEPSPVRGPARDTPSLDAYRAFTEGWLRLESLDVREMPRAIAELERAVAIDPHYALAFAGLASAELALYESTRSGNEPRRDLLEQASDHARHAVSLGAALAEAQATLALVLVSAGQMAEAAASAQRAVALEPSNWRHLFRLGHASWGEARLRAARRTLSLYPEFAFAHFQMAMVHVARNDLAAAETILRHGAAVQDRQIGRGGRYPALGLHWLLGLVRLAHDDVEEAGEEFEREEALAETYRLYGREYTLHARYAHAAARLRSGHPDQSITLLDRALALYPAHAESHILMAVAREAAGNRDAARTAMAEAERAIVQLTRGRPADATVARAQVLAAGSRFDEATDALRRLITVAPPGFTGWVLPVDPLLRELVDTQGFGDVLTVLAERAR